LKSTPEPGSREEGILALFPVREMNCGQCGKTGTLRAFIDAGNGGKIRIRRGFRIAIQADGSPSADLRNAGALVRKAIQQLGNRAIVMECGNCKARTHAGHGKA